MTAKRSARSTVRRSLTSAMMGVAAGAVAVTAGAFGLASCGDEPARTVVAVAGRNVEVHMTDNHFDVSLVQVRVGQKVTFEFHNDGAVGHEAWIGDAAAQRRHDRERGAIIDDDDPNGIAIGRGGYGTLTHTFDTPGRIIVGCHQGNHYAQGMLFTVLVK